MKGEKCYVLLLAVVFIIALLILPSSSFAISEEDIKASMVTINEQLEARGQNVRVAAIEYFTAADVPGQIVFFDDRTKLAEYAFVPADFRRGGAEYITWLSDWVDGTATGLTSDETQAALERAMDTWNEVQCATIPLILLSDYGLDWGYMQSVLGLGGIPGWYADITHAGWLPGLFFDLVAPPNGSDYILGVTFTLIWTESGVPTDIDNNGKYDVAFQEIYYNNDFPWGVDSDFDVETVVLHEAGHALCLDHFGNLFMTNNNGKLHFAPRAVMNAGYTGVQQELTGTDISGFCTIWGSWPME